VLTFIETSDAALVIPGQTAQEFWNNHGNFAIPIDQVSNQIQKVQNELDALSLDPDLAERLERIKRDLQVLLNEAKDAANPQLIVQSKTLWSKLDQIASTPYVPRADFLPLAQVRFDTKTPPGFADDKKVANRFGDFFVWADLLLGLMVLPERAERGRVVFVTDDAKPDWRASGEPHPVLAAEAKEATGLSLSMMKVDEFIRLVRA
jgi:hypothetical protein